ncbi:ABC transporter permease [Bradyrhizobium prioriisuperbiae]|uniref:ABC transporter permease n=1 Tax=Bradyrhizobium prioriisuperbiae TaxID=2854389 RepID=UPI0028E29FEC|nr:ABC transporter permease [Bradyrhizobium prioritasuperba]
MKQSVARLPWILFCAAILVFVISPTIFTAYYSFGPSKYFQFPIASYSLKWYSLFFESSKFQSAMIRTAILAGIVTPVCLLVALGTAHVMARGSLRSRRLLDAIALSPLVVPGIVTGIAFLSVFRLAGIESGLVRMMIAMLVVCLPFALRAIAANYQNIDPATEEAARDLGAGAFAAYLNVTFPQLKPGFLAGAVFVFVEVIDNFSVNAFLTDLNSDTLSITAYQHIRDFDDPLVAVMSTLLSIITLVAVLLVQKAIGLDNVVKAH